MAKSKGRALKSSLKTMPTDGGDASGRILRTILIVDDSRAQRKILGAQLLRAGYSVVEAATADEALVLCQSLLPKVGGGRALAVEVMVPNDAIRALIRDGKLHQIYSQMQLGQGIHEMQTFNQSLADLVQRNLVSPEVALKRSSDKEELRGMLERGQGLGQVRRRV